MPTLELGGRDATRSAVANRLGIGFATKHYARWDIKAGRLKALNVPQLRLKRTMYIAVHRRRENSFPVRAFIDFLDAMKVHGKIEKS